MEAISKYHLFETPCDVINTNTSGDIGQGEEDSGSTYANTYNTYLNDFEFPTKDEMNRVLGVE